jgi:DNA polymerase-1
MAIELIKKLKPDYVAVAWDKPKTNIRKRLAIYPEYKAGRKPAPPDFYTQIPILHDLLKAFGWPLYELDDYEADDIMATLAVKARQKNIETLLITSDLDALQVVNGGVKVYALKKGFSNIEEFHPESFIRKYGLEPWQYLDLKALKGDSSDNIPGVPGIGEKTAIELLKKYKTLDGVYQNIDDIPEKLRAKLIAGKKMAYLSKEIARLWTDAPIKLDLRAMDAKKLDTIHLKQLLQKLEFRSLLNALPDFMRAEVPPTKTLGDLKLKIVENIIIDSDDKLQTFFKSWSWKDKIFIHSRAAGRHGANPQVLILGAKKTVCTIDLTKLDLKAVGLQLAALGSSWLVGYDLKSDLKLLKNIGIEAKNVAHDVMVAAFLINPLQRAQSLTELAINNLGYEGAEFEDLPTEDLIARAPELISVIMELYYSQLKTFDNLPKIKKLASEIEWPLTKILADMEMLGIKLDTLYLKEFSHQLKNSIAKLEQNIYKQANYRFNISSPIQLADVLFVKLNLPHEGIKRGKTGYSTAASELEKLRGLHPIIDLIGQYREVVKLKNTYVDTLPNMVDKNSRLHTTFNLTIAPTGRLSSTDPNLQNIPVRTELGRNIRRAFVADKDNVLVSADYSQFELRLAAALSGDEGMIEAFNKDEDIHIQTAALILGIPPEKVTKADRYAAKAVNFGIIYGQGPHGLSQQTGLDFTTSRMFIDKYFEVRPKLKEYIDKLRKQALERGYVETIMGRRRPTPDVKSSNFAVREAAYRAAINHPMQGSAADLMKMAMIKVQHELDRFTANNQVADKPKMLLQIHDSLLVECRKEDSKKVGDLLKNVMENVYPKLPVKLKVDIAIGKNWGEL